MQTSKEALKYSYEKPFLNECGCRVFRSSFTCIFAHHIHYYSFICSLFTRVSCHQKKNQIFWQLIGTVSFGLVDQHSENKNCKSRCVCQNKTGVHRLLSTLSRRQYFRYVMFLKLISKALEIADQQLSSPTLYIWSYLPSLYPLERIVKNIRCLKQCNSLPFFN
jgi:hypothetical protein